MPLDIKSIAVMPLAFPHPERIMQAAIRRIEDQKIFTLPKPATHSAIANAMTRTGNVNIVDPKRFQQGFITADGVFVDRGTAAQLVGSTASKLFCQDIW